jgi:hypothetical protein
MSRAHGSTESVWRSRQLRLVGRVAGAAAVLVVAVTGTAGGASAATPTASCTASAGSSATATVTASCVVSGGHAPMGVRWQ